MPMIRTKTNLELSAETEKRLKEKLGKAIEAIPGKSERWLMLEFADRCRLWFQGDSSRPLAFVEVMLYGSASDSAYDALTEAITRILGEELGIAPDCVYVEYQETGHWGWNGSNF